MTFRKTTSGTDGKGGMGIYALHEVLQNPTYEQIMEADARAERMAIAAPEMLEALEPLAETCAAVLGNQHVKTLGSVMLRLTIADAEALVSAVRKARGEK